MAHAAKTKAWVETVWDPDHDIISILQYRTMSDSPDVTFPIFIPVINGLSHLKRSLIPLLVVTILEQNYIFNLSALISCKAKILDFVTCLEFIKF